MSAWFAGDRRLVDFERVLLLLDERALFAFGAGFSGDSAVLSATDGVGVAVSSDWAAGDFRFSCGFAA